MDPATIADHSTRLARDAAKLAEDAIRIASEATQLAAAPASSGGDGFLSIAVKRYLAGTFQSFV